MKEEKNVLHFHLNDGHAHAKIFILEEDIIRILLTEGEALTLEKTWSVAPGQIDVPWEGRHRLDMSGFTLPQYEFQQVKD
ncbi:hypothetical protein MOF51_21170, partial [Bacillus paralicheniformis]